VSQLLQTPCTAFAGLQCLVSGQLADVVLKTKQAIDEGEHGTILIFDDLTSEPVEVDFRGSADDVLARLEARQNEPPSVSEPAEQQQAVRGPGRPRLGVVPREVTLLPRHWQWLNSQPGGASVALRKIVDEARRANEGKDRIRQSQNAAFKFMSALAGNLTGFEESLRALFAGNQDRFNELIEPWPEGVRDHAKKLAATAFSAPTAPI
jgi:uncharacterized protein